MINIAQIGIGYWGPNHLRNRIANKKCRVKTIVDITPERRDFVKSLYPAVNITDDVQDVFSNSSLNTVVIATPATTHFDLAISALKSGKEILTYNSKEELLDAIKKVLGQDIKKS